MLPCMLCRQTSPEHLLTAMHDMEQERMQNSFQGIANVRFLLHHIVPFFRSLLRLVLCDPFLDVPHNVSNSRI